MKVSIWRHERWPDYGISKDTASLTQVDITEDLYARYLKVNEEYDGVQKELEVAYKTIYKIYNQ